MQRAYVRSFASTRDAKTAPRPRALRVGDELEQAPVGVAEVDATTRPARAGTFDWAEFDNHPASIEMRDGVLDRAVPREAQVAVAGLNGQPRHRRRRHAR